MSDYSIIKNWRDFLSSKAAKAEVIISFLSLLVILILYANFLNIIETRHGFSFNDPVLKLFNPIDLTWLIFIIIYGALLAGIILLIRNPENLMFTIQVYSSIILVRIAAMYLLPLSPPHNMIVLHDPLIEALGTGQTLNNDLFFSGHTATLFLLYLVNRYNKSKYFFLTATLIVAAAVLLQHVHYTIDVFAAIFFTYACYHIINKLKNKLG